MHHVCRVVGDARHARLDQSTVRTEYAVTEVLFGHGRPSRSRYKHSCKRSLNDSTAAKLFVRIYDKDSSYCTTFATLHLQHQDSDPDWRHPLTNHI